MKDYIDHSNFFLVVIFLLSTLNLLAQSDNSLVPPKRAHHSLVYDEQAKTILLSNLYLVVETGHALSLQRNYMYNKERKKIIIFGGRLGWPNDANDTWEWDGSKWTEIKF